MSIVLDIIESILLQYHGIMNNKLWNHNVLKPEVREHLLDVANKWIAFSKIPLSDVCDITLTGGNANYNYTPLSDIDVHVMVDRSTVGKDIGVTLINDYLQRMKSAYKNKDYVEGFPVELYAMDVNEGLPKGEGVYSIQDNHWIQAPKLDSTILDIIHRPTFRVKLDSYKNLIDCLIRTNAPVSEFRNLADKLHTMRGTAIHDGGEFAIENLIFKELRNTGYLDKMKAHMHSSTSSNDSIAA